MEHISSRSALDACTSRLLTAAATLDDTGLGALGQDLAAVAGLLSQAPTLRRTLSEATTSPQARSGILARLLRGKVGTPALDLLGHAVGEHWANGRDLTEGVARLGRTAMFLRAERTGELDDVEDQLFRFARIVDATGQLSVILDDPAGDPQGRAALVGRLLDGRAHPLTVELLTSLARDAGGRSFAHGVHDLVVQAAERRDKLVAVAVSPIPLTREQTQRLGAALERIYHRQLVVHVEVDPAVQGGMRITVGDEVIDGSVSGKLAALRSRLAG